MSKAYIFESTKQKTEKDNDRLYQKWVWFLFQKRNNLDKLSYRFIYCHIDSVQAKASFLLATISVKSFKTSIVVKFISA